MTLPDAVSIHDMTRELPTAVQVRILIHHPTIQSWPSRCSNSELGLEETVTYSPTSGTRLSQPVVPDQAPVRLANPTNPASSEPAGTQSPGPSGHFQRTSGGAR